MQTQIHFSRKHNALLTLPGLINILLVSNSDAITYMYDKDKVSAIFPIICNAFFEEKKRSESQIHLNFKKKKLEQMLRIHRS